jgi:hypothetical protein
MIVQVIAPNRFAVEPDDKVLSINIDLNLANVNRVSYGILTSIWADRKIGSRFKNVTVCDGANFSLSTAEIEV